MNFDVTPYSEINSDKLLTFLFNVAVTFMLLSWPILCL